MTKTALITGASSSIGSELSKLFAADGYNLILVARNEQKLNDLAAGLTETHGINALVLARDLSDPTSPRAIFATLQKESIDVDVLVNNAGTQVYGQFDEADSDKLLAMIQVNLTALTHLTKLCLSGMLEKGHGKILNVASTGAYVPGPLNAVYCATKAYVLSFSEALGAELSGTGVTVTTLCPGATDTAFVTRPGLENVRLLRHMMSAEQVAAIGYRALMQGRHVAIAGLGNKLQVLAFQLMAPLMPLMPPYAIKHVGSYIIWARRNQPKGEETHHYGNMVHPIDN